MTLKKEVFQRLLIRRNSEDQPRTYETHGADGTQYRGRRKQFAN